MTRIRSRIRSLLVPAAGGPLVVAAAPVVPLREIFRRFWPYARPYRKWIAVGMLFAVAVPAIETAEIWLFKLVVDDVLVPKELAPLLPIAIAYVALTLMGGLLSFGDEYVATWVGEKFLLNLRGRLYAHVQDLSLDALDRRRLGDVLSRLTSDVQAIESFVLSGISDGLSSIVRILFFGGALFYLDWQLALVSLVVAPLFYVVAKRFSRLVKHAAREKRRRSGSLGAVAEEGIANAALVQGYNRQSTEVARFKRENEGILQAELASARIRGLFAPIVDLLELIGAMVVIGFGTLALTQGSLTLGGLLVFLTYLTQLYGPIRDLSRLSNTIFAASAGAERVIELLEERPAVAERPDARAIGRARGRVELREVSFRYPGASRNALDGVSLTVEPGHTVALVGPSGAGKSTVARLLMRFADPASGSIHLDGQDLRDLSLESLRDNLGVLLQETLIFDGTVRENIAYGREGATDHEIEAAARAAGGHEFIEALPDGYDSRIGQRGRTLSGGQRQRIAIARVLVRDAPVVVLDEPGTGLDEATKVALIEPLRRLMVDRATVVISHDLLAVREADEIVVMEDGRVAERGAHDELLAAGGRYAALCAASGLEGGAARAGAAAVPA
jgi:ATP-binding cassette, subfamily B, bacterial